MSVLRKRKRQEQPYDVIDLPYRGERYAHLRDVHVTDEYDFARTAKQMAPELSPYWNEFYDGMVKFNKLGVLDQETFMSAMGPWTAKDTRHVATMPLGMLVGLWSQDPDFLQDKPRVYRFLHSEEGRDFKMPTCPNKPI